MMEKYTGLNATFSVPPAQSMDDSQYQLPRQDLTHDDGLLKRTRALSVGEDRPAKSRRISTESTLVESDHVTSAKDDSLEPLVLGGIKIRNLRLVSVRVDGEERSLASFPPDSKSREAQAGTNVPDGVTGTTLAHVGDAKLLGIVPVKVYIFQNGEAISSLYQHPYTEIVRVIGTEKLSLGTLIPGLANSEWDVIQLIDPKFGFVGGSKGRMIDRGMFFETDLVFSGALQPVSNFLRDFFKQENPGIRFSAWLGHRRQYDKIEVPGYLLLRGSLRDINLNVFDILQFHEMGVELLGSPQYNVRKKKTEWRFGFGFFGNLHMSVPGTDIPLQVDYQLRKFMDTWELSIRLRDEKWKGVFGIKNLILSEVEMLAKLDGTNPKSSKLSFAVSASMQLRQAHMNISGSYSKDHYSLSVFVGNLTLRDIGQILKELLGFDLDVFDYDVKFEAMTLTISSDGLFLAGAVSINGHTSASGSLKLSKDGIEITGEIGDIKFKDWDLLIRVARFEVFIASKMSGASARTAAFAIKGGVSYHGVDADVTLSTEKDAKLGWVWTVYGDVKGDLSTSRLIPALKGNEMLDISLNRLTIIASSREVPAGTIPDVPYRILRGVQLCAGINRIAALEALVGGSVEGMGVRAAYSAGVFTLNLLLPAQRTIRLSPTVWTGPIELGIEIGMGKADLVVAGVLNMQVDGQPGNKPLQLLLRLAVGPVQAGFGARMLTPWANPCNIGKEVTISGGAIEMDIIYSSFLMSGPGSIAFAGGLAVGSKSGSIAMKISQNPKDQLITAHLEDVSVADLVDFASKITEKQLPPVSKDLLHFHTFDVYLSTGASIVGENYPPGASVKGDMTVFGKRTKFECTFGGMIKIMATIEKFSLGPLTVRGASRPDPLVDIEFSSEAQKIIIDGAVDVWGSTAALFLDARLRPETTFKFFLHLKLDDLFLLELEAQLVGTIKIHDYKTWADADFYMNGLMKQQLIDHITTQLDQQIATAHNAFKADLEKEQADLKVKEDAFRAECDEAAEDVEAARQKYLSKEQQVQDGFRRVRESTTAERMRWQAKVDDAERAFNELIAQSKDKLEQTRSDAASAILAAKPVVDVAEQNKDTLVRDAQAKVQQAVDAFNQEFETRISDLKAWQGKASSLRLAISLQKGVLSNLKQDRDRYSKLGWDYWEKDGLVTAAQVTLDGIERALKLNDEVCRQAETFLQSSQYINSQYSVTAANATLVEVQRSTSSALSGAKENFDKVTTAQNKLVQDAVNALIQARTVSRELQLVDAAKKGLADTELVGQQLIATSQKTVNDLSSCVEFITFGIAQKMLLLAKENTSELNLARHAVNVMKDAADLGVDLAKWATDHAAKTFNIREVKFSGSVSSLVNADENSAPLTASIKGTVLGENIDWEIVWKPSLNLVRFIKELFRLLWEKIQEMAKEIFK
ncbi:hypothetical protein AK830_g2094 [Neonectria ditissima]|uniref:Uncharacterized protein n=1 Tax=Neonectria ditissima TaxID=78410 RepID=A0A0N8H8G0_9HYPO|nr:hypothetical protein AK830_g2094 [Neonectria ditissima]